MINKSGVQKGALLVETVRFCECIDEGNELLAYSAAGLLIYTGGERKTSARVPAPSYDPNISE